MPEGVTELNLISLNKVKDKSLVTVIGHVFDFLPPVKTAGSGE